MWRRIFLYGASFLDFRQRGGVVSRGKTGLSGRSMKKSGKGVRNLGFVICEL
jgi:hypothetical protein